MQQYDVDYIAAFVKFLLPVLPVDYNYLIRNKLLKCSDVPNETTSFYLKCLIQYRRRCCLLTNSKQVSGMRAFALKFSITTYRSKGWRQGAKVIYYCKVPVKTLICFHIRKSPADKLEASAKLRIDQFLLHLHT